MIVRTAKIWSKGRYLDLPYLADICVYSAAISMCAFCSVQIWNEDVRDWPLWSSGYV